MTTAGYVRIERLQEAEAAMSKCACRGHALVLGEDYILDQKGKWHSLSVCSTHLALEVRVR